MPKQYSLVYFRAREGENVEKRQRYHVVTNLIRTGAACQVVVPLLVTQRSPALFTTETPSAVHYDMGERRRTEK